MVVQNDTSINTVVQIGLTCERENGGERHHGQLEGEGGQAGQLSGEAQLLHIMNSSFFNVNIHRK